MQSADWLTRGNVTYGVLAWGCSSFPAVDLAGTRTQNFSRQHIAGFPSGDIV